MKIFSFIIVLLFIISLSVKAQSLRKIDHSAFSRGEKLTYRVFYDSFITGKLVAGRAILEISKENKQFYDRNSLHIVGLGRTAGFFNWFFKVADRYETYLDKEAVAPWCFVRRIQEGGFKKSQDVNFNQFEHIAESNTDTVCIPEYTQDLISSIYYARTFDFSNLTEGDEFNIQFFLDDSVFISKIIYEGLEEVKVKAGKFRCLKFKPMMLTGDVFDDPYPMSLWITDDRNRIPILVESDVMIGSVKMDLTNYSGLSNPLESKIK